MPVPRRGVPGVVRLRLEALRGKRRARVRALLAKRPGLWAWPLLSKFGLEPEDLLGLADARAALGRDALLEVAEPGQVARSVVLTEATEEVRGLLHAFRPTRAAPTSTSTGPARSTPTSVTGAANLRR